MQKIALPVIFISAVAAALFYVSQEEHGAGTLALLASVLLVGQVCATLPFIFEAKKASRPNASGTADPAGTQRIVANQQVIHEDLRSLGDALIKRFAAITERQDALEKKVLAELAKGTPELAGELNDLFAKISGKVEESLEEFSKDADDRLSEVATRSDLEARLERIENRINEFGNILKNLRVVEVEDDEEENSEAEEDADESESDVPAPLPDADFPETEDADDDAEKIVDENDWRDEDDALPVSAEPESEASVEDFPEDELDSPTAPELVPAEEEHVEQGELALGDMPPAKGATLVLDAMLGIENKPFLRGNAPGLSESAGTPMTFVEIGRWSYDFAPLTEEVSVRILRNDDETFPLGEITIAPGQTLELDYIPEA